MHITPYLTFKGESQEAIDLYSRAFKTRPTEIMRFSNLPQNPNEPMSISDVQKNWVLQATLPFGNTLLHISDTLGELNDAASERNAIAVECDPETTKFAFAVLAEEGRIGIPLQKTFFSPCHGVVFDKFGVMWNFISQSEKQ